MRLFFAIALFLLSWTSASFAQTELASVANLAALKALSAGEFPSVYRQGFSEAGDGGAATYTWSSNACSLNSGAGDNGLQVKPTSGTGCWLAQTTVASVKLYGAPGNGDTAPLSTIYGSLAAAQVYCPAATALTNEIDWCAAKLAAATGLPVYMPTGNYVFSDGVTLQPGQLAYGDAPLQGAYSTGITINYNNFNQSALGVFVFATGAGFGSDVHDIAFNFGQTASTRSAMNPYPPAIYAQGVPRFKIANLRISGAEYCVDMRGNSGGAYLDDIECGAYGIGLQIDGSLDFVHVNQWHDWLFGINIAVWGDGNTVAANIGQCDSCIFKDFSTFQGSVNLLSDATGFTAAVLALDGDYADLNISGGSLNTIAGMYMSSNASENRPKISASGGTTTITGFNALFANTTSLGAINVSGSAIFKISDGYIFDNNGAYPCIQETGTTLSTTLAAGTAFMTVLSSSNIAIGNAVSGTGIPPSTYVTSISGTTIGINNNFTSSGAVNVTFATPTLTLDNINFNPGIGNIHTVPFVWSQSGLFAMRHNIFAAPPVSLAASTTMSTTSGSAVIVVASNSGIQVGGPVLGNGIPANTNVLAISGTNITLSQSATATASGQAVSFYAANTFGVKIDTDTQGDDYSDNNLNGWAESIVAGAYQGVYGPNKIQLHQFTPTITFNTPGTFVPTYTFQQGAYWYDRNGVHFHIFLRFNTNSFTSASGNIIISGFPFGMTNINETNGISQNNIVANSSSYITLGSGYTTLSAVYFSQGGTSSAIYLFESGSGVPFTALSPFAIPTSTSNVQIELTGYVPL